MADPLDDAAILIEDLISQACHRDDDGMLDSMAISTYARGIRWLAERGLVEIVSENGRRVVAKWPDTPNDGRQA